MKLIRGIQNIKKEDWDSILTIGNFDGVHLGHQYVLKKIKNIAKQYNKSIMIMLFEPQPLEFFKKLKSPTRLTPFHEKIKQLFLLNIDSILCIEFDIYFSSLTAINFIKNILIKKLHISHLILGYDCQFGADKKGNIKLLKTIIKKNEFNIIQLKQHVLNNGTYISSTDIRKALLNNNFKLAESLLGRPFSITGTISIYIHKNKNTEISTAIILLNNYSTPIYGMFSVIFTTKNQKKIIGIANINKKTYQDKHLCIIHIHVKNIIYNLHSQYIEIFFYKKMKNINYFKSIQEEQQQLLNNINKTKKYLNHYF
ncbi:MAG: riboflavin biosynthesis protein RibF [Buchnera aphidicola (Eriosoma harunire)]